MAFNGSGLVHLLGSFQNLNPKQSWMLNCSPLHLACILKGQQLQGVNWKKKKKILALLGIDEDTCLPLFDMITTHIPLNLNVTVIKSRKPRVLYSWTPLTWIYRKTFHKQKAKSNTWSSKLANYLQRLRVFSAFEHSSHRYTASIESVYGRWRTKRFPHTNSAFIPQALQCVIVLLSQCWERGSFPSRHPLLTSPYQRHHNLSRSFSVFVSKSLALLYASNF